LICTGGSSGASGSSRTTSAGSRINTLASAGKFVPSIAHVFLNAKGIDPLFHPLLIRFPITAVCCGLKPVLDMGIPRDVIRLKPEILESVRASEFERDQMVQLTADALSPRSAVGLRAERAARSPEPISCFRLR
jgi:hypothetical protein